MTKLTAPKDGHAAGTIDADDIPFAPVRSKSHRWDDRGDELRAAIEQFRARLAADGRQLCDSCRLITPKENLQPDPGHGDAVCPACRTNHEQAAVTLTSTVPLISTNEPNAADAVSHVVGTSNDSTSYVSPGSNGSNGSGVSSRTALGLADGSGVSEEEDVDVAAALLRGLGVDAPLGSTFRCVLPGHEHDATVRPTAAGYWHYECEGLHGGGVGLAEVRAMLAYGRVRYDLSGAQLQKWRDRLESESGLVERDTFSFMDEALSRLPADCPREARWVAYRMAMLVSLRNPRYWDSGVPFVFARDFAPAYCERTRAEVRGAMRYLERVGFIRRAKEPKRRGEPIEWLLAAQEQ